MLAPAAPRAAGSVSGTRYAAETFQNRDAFAVKPLEAHLDAITLLRNRAEVEPRSFTTDSTLGVGASPYAVAAGDITGDGVPDLVSADSGANQISVLISQAGGWAPPVAFEVGFEPFDVALGELDGDGRLDVVTADFGGGSLSVLRTAE